MVCLRNKYKTMKWFNLVMYFLGGLAMVIIVFNSYLLFSFQFSSSGKIKLSGNLAQDAIKIAISEGVPEIYGQELGISFSNVQPAINIMKQFDPAYGRKKIKLTGDLLKRYIAITTRISCEFCCGALAITNKDGSPGCGCAHAQAMRGLAAYLLKYHSQQYTNDQVLRELARWKGRYFPKQMIKKTADQIKSGKYTPDIAALLLDIDVSKISNTSAPLPSDIQNLPSMVGGC